MNQSRSNVADLLTRTLQYIAADIYDASNDRFIIFGVCSLEEAWEDYTNGNEGQNSAFSDAVQNFASETMLHHGREQLGSRTSLRPNPLFMSQALLNFSDEDALRLLTLMQEMPVASSVTQLPKNADESYVAQALTQDFLGRLPKAIRRSVDLDEVKLDRIPNEAVQSYFEEAHRCYLLGLEVACAVMCRAVLEAGLDHALGKKGSKLVLKNKIELATNNELLGDDRPNWAHQIREAGNDAVHNYLTFDGTWGGRLDVILLNTRKILIDLYSERDQFRDHPF